MGDLFPASRPAGMERVGDAQSISVAEIDSSLRRLQKSIDLMDLGDGF